MLYEVITDVSSQYISALLMIGPVLKNGLTLHLTGEIISRPYINLTLQLMTDFGAKAEWISENCIRVAPHPYSDTAFRVESDWSAASYWYQIAALSSQSSIKLKGLFEKSYQGDSRGAAVFTKLGIATEFTDGDVILVITSYSIHYTKLYEKTNKASAPAIIMSIPVYTTGNHGSLTS